MHSPRPERFVAAVIACASALVLLGAAVSSGLRGQELPRPSSREAAQGPTTAPTPPTFVSPEVLPDKRVTFRIFAPKADEVRLAGTDIPRNTQGLPMTKHDAGVW